jgi:hypothetical protein
MNQYLGGRMTQTVMRLRLMADFLGSASNGRQLQEVIEILEGTTQILRMYQLEWQKQVLIGAKFDQSEKEVGENSMGGLIRIDL